MFSSSIWFNGLLILVNVFELLASSCFEQALKIKHKLIMETTILGSLLYLNINLHTKKDVSNADTLNFHFLILHNQLLWIL